MNKHLELRLTGSGGQGLITAGIILAEAAIKDNMNAIQTQSYGPEARGGASKAEVIISSDDIDFPKVELPDMTLVLTQVACDKYSKDVSKEGVLIVDESLSLADNIDVKKIIRVPILSAAKNDVGRSIVANIVSLGVIVGYTEIVSRESLKEAILSRIPLGTEELNKAALNKGFELADQLIK